MAPHKKDVSLPLGIVCIQKASSTCCPTKTFNRNFWYRSSVLVLTFLAYASYHMNRKTISVVKAVLHRNCSTLTPPTNESSDTWCDWAPFDGSDYSTLLGLVDSSFLFAYALAMFISGLVAERVNLRYYLTLGMICSGIAACLMGLARYWDLHLLYYFIIVQVFGGISQTTGWPGVVAVMGNWFGKGKRGFIFGVWNSHTSIGNILGTVIPGIFVEYNWGLSFIVPGIMIIIVGLLNFLFLVQNPSDVNCVIPEQNRSEAKTKSNHIQMDRMSEAGSPGPLRGSKYLRKRSSIKFKTRQKQNRNTKPFRQIFKSVKNVVDNKSDINSSYERLPSTDDDEDSEIEPHESEDPDDIFPDAEHSRNNSEGRPILLPDQEPKPIGFIGALKIPGVIEFSMCLFFAKLVSYTFLYWLPQYISTSTTLGATLSADVSTVFDLGGIVGGITAGIISDYSGKSASTCAVMLIVAIPVLQVYNLYASISVGLNMTLLVLCGLLVNGPYALITTAVSAELGTHQSLQGNGKAVATVTAIIDGTGSIGAAVGPLMAGVVSGYGWVNVFYMLMVADIFALLLLSRLVKREIFPSSTRSHSSEWQV